MEIAAGVFFLAFFVEGLIKYLFGDNTTLANRWYLPYVSLILGIGLAIAYKINLPASIGITTGIPLINFIVSGLIIGRGSNYLNDFVGYFRKS